MSNKRIDKLMKEFLESGQTIDAISAPPLTYVVVALGDLVGVGYMRCRADEAFSFDNGMVSALRRALKHIDEQRKSLKELHKGTAEVIFDFTSDVSPLVFNQ